ncbi:MAG TPA: Ig-like domain-containing protein, partial [Gemmatimonadales bacterium]|nr:Ig-like domain-containing protein [Gemmatimonadales bacterium]
AESWESRQRPWELPPDSKAPEPRRQRSRPGWLVGTGGLFLLAGGFWLAGGSRPVEAPPAESAVALRDSTPGEVQAIPAVSVPVPDSAAPVSVTITERPARPMEVGSSARLAVEVRDDNGRTVPAADVVWSSTDSSVVAVDSATGTVQAIGKGRAQVIAAAGELRDTARIVVRTASRTEPEAPTVPASLRIQPHAPLQVGDTLTLSVRVLDQRGAAIRGARVSWSSSEPKVAAVNPTTGRVRAYAPGNTVIIARSGEESAITSLSVLPQAVSSVAILGAAPLKVGDTLDLTAEPRDRYGRAIAERQAVWSSSSPEVAAVDSRSGTVIATAPGSTEITATVDGKSVSRQLTVLKQPRTGRVVEPVGELAAQTTGNTPQPDPAAERQRIVGQMLAGVERCYGALQRNDVAQVELLYKPETRDDREKLRKLARILYTKEWEATVGPRADGAQRVEERTAVMEFGFRMTWKDAFGGRITSQPVFRADFVRDGSSLQLSSCRIINSPRL